MKPAENVSHSPQTQRFDQEANPWESIVLVFISIMKRICLDSRTLTDKVDRDAMVGTARFLDLEMCLNTAMYAQY